MYNSLQLRELFHLEFLRWFGRRTKAGVYALKGGANLRFFFKSFRYSEDMDLDVRGIGVAALKDTIMGILQSPSFYDTLKPFGVERVVPPDILKAEQTETTQRFKVHLVTFAGEDLFTKVEFSRRGFKGNVIVNPVSDIILREYKMPPLLVPHYDIQSAITQKIGALAARPTIQARDIFDLYILISQRAPGAIEEIGEAKLTKARENVLEVSFGQFRDTVLSYLSSGDRAQYDLSSLWDEVKLKVSDFIGQIRR
ncbi:MAG: nucleotidyl transferase AbiEii/AbiGii toxin family protein [Candidatus Omnitrophica bacterium]|nr:nucleotidyl transferase AbiEii/AbiGii toxin family protein [Candidatus Omnitrophota bacterium]